MPRSSGLPPSPPCVPSDRTLTFVCAARLRAMIPAVNVEDNPSERRYEATDNGKVLGFAEYRVKDGVYWMFHTEIAEGHSGTGVGAYLVRSALDDLRSKGARIVPTCPFVAGWIRRHREYDTMVDHETLRAFKRKRAKAAQAVPTVADRGLPCAHVPADLQSAPEPFPVDGCYECIRMGDRTGCISACVRSAVTSDARATAQASTPHFTPSAANTPWSAPTSRARTGGTVTSRPSRSMSTAHLQPPPIPDKRSPSGMVSADPSGSTKTAKDKTSK